VLTCKSPENSSHRGRLDAPVAGWPPKVSRVMKRIATLAFYAIGTLAILCLALYAYAMMRPRSFTPGEPIHIFRNPDAPDYS
jgi:hypothetical protein